MTEQTTKSTDWKHVFTSKTIWFNLVAIVAFIVQSKTGYVVDENLQTQVLAIVNLLLRFITKEEIRWTAPKENSDGLQEEK